MLLLPFLLAASMNGFYVFSGLGLDIIASMGVNLWRWARGQSEMVVLFEYGFTYNYAGMQRSLAWDDITGIERRWVGKYGPLVSVRTRDSRAFLFTGRSLSNSEGLFKVIVETVYLSQQQPSLAYRRGCSDTLRPR